MSITSSLAAPATRLVFLQRNALFLLCVAVHSVVAFTILAHKGVPLTINMTATLSGAFGLMLPVFAWLYVVWRYLVMAVVVRPRAPRAWLVEDLRAVFLDWERLLAGTTVLAGYAVFMAVFTSFKTAIPILNAFSWDIAFAELDRVLHGGVDPYRITMAMFGTPLATTAINAAYHAWLFVVFFVVIAAGFSRGNSSARNTFLIAFALTWAIGGNYMAAVFSSAGPVYFEQLGFGQDFAPLMATLEGFHETSPVWALKVQDLLWQGYTEGGPISGISAFPSMHVASTAVIALYAYRLSWWGGIAATVFTAVIVIGSVHLAWHYAVDSYAGLLIAALCWKFAGWLVSRDPFHQDS